MRRKALRLWMPCCLAFLSAAAATVGAAAELSAELAPLASFVGKTWRGTMTGSGDEAPMEDVSRWERILNGKAIRILHSVNEGEYGGETIIVWDPVKEGIVFFYFTTAGFYTNGTITILEGKMMSRETVVGNSEGITEVEATSEILPDGRLHTSARYLQRGEWVDGHEFHYVEDPGAEVKFR